MERPEIKDKKVLEYVLDLERQLDNFKSDKTIAKSYIANKKFLDGVNAVVYACDIDITTIMDKDDKVIDRASKFVDNLISYNEKLQKLEGMVNPKVITDADAEIRESGSILEEALRKKNNGTP